MAHTGLNRAAIESEARALVMKVTGLPEEQVIWARDQGNTTAVHRPFVSMFIRTPENEVRAGMLQYGKIHEYWRTEVQGATDGDYTVTVSDVPHTISASGLTATQIRDALVAELASSTTSTSSGPGAISVDTVANDHGDRLMTTVSSPSGELSLVRLRGNIVEVTAQEVEPVLELFCWGLYDETTPSSEDYGEATSERLAMAFMSPFENAAFRRTAHAIRRVRFLEQDRQVAGEVETIGVVQITLGALACHVVDLGDTREIPFNCTGSGV